jgi:DNA-binding response OmpR family regulator
MHSLSNYTDQHPLILVIEEDLQVLQELAATLNSAGYEARCCSTSEEASASTRDARPDLILCDVVIHERGGTEICEQLKREMAPGEVPVMFLSANQIPDIIRRRSPFGGSYYLRKPFDAEVLLDLLDKTLNSTRQMAMAER